MRRSAGFADCTTVRIPADLAILARAAARQEGMGERQFIAEAVRSMIDATTNYEGVELSFSRHEIAALAEIARKRTEKPLEAQGGARA